MKPSYTPTMQAQNKFVLFCDWKDILNVIVQKIASATEKILWNDPTLSPFYLKNVMKISMGKIIKLCL